MKRLPFTERRGTAGIVAAVILFAMLFTVGTSYFVLVNNTNLQYSKSSTVRQNAYQGSMFESLTATTYLNTVNSHIEFYVNNTGTLNVNVTTAFLFDSTGTKLACAGVGAPSGSCAGFTPNLPISLNSGKGSAVIDTGQTYTSGTETLKLITARGNVYTALYPAFLPGYAKQAQSSGSLTINLQTFKWYQPTGDQQSGGLVSGFPTDSIPITKTNILFAVQFNNQDPNNRAVTLWPGSQVVMETAVAGSNGKNLQVSSFFIVQSFVGGNAPTGIVGYNTSQDFIVLPVNTPVTLYFGATTPYGTAMNNVNQLNAAPFNALFSLVGVYNDNTEFAQTIPFPAGIMTGATGTLSGYSGTTGATITLSGSGKTWLSNSHGFVGWIVPGTGAVTTLTKFTFDSNGNFPSGLSFQVPSASSGYYIVMISDYYDSLYYVFQHT